MAAMVDTYKDRLLKLYHRDANPNIQLMRSGPRQSHLYQAIFL